MSGESLAGRDLISLLDFDTEELQRMLEVGIEVKANPRHYSRGLEGRTLFLYLEKPSLRTRVTFETGMTQLGSTAISLLKVVPIYNRLKPILVTAPEIDASKAE